MIATPSYSQSSHGETYELINGLEGIRRALLGSTARLEAAPQAANLPSDTDIDQISDFFVNIYDTSGVTPPSPEQRAALAHAIGTADRDNESNTEIPAGFTFLGQFLDHDVTRNEMQAIRRLRNIQIQVASASPDAYLGIVTEVLRNARTSLLDLDSVYGLSNDQLQAFFQDEGTDQICTSAAIDTDTCIDLNDLDPAEASAIAAYELDGSGRLSGRFRVSFRASSLGGPIIADLPRCSDSFDLIGTPACPTTEGFDTALIHRAVIGDGRNDENVIIAQIHAIFLLAHNKLFDLALGDVDEPTLEQKLAAFNTARTTLIHHWQELVMDDYLTEHMGRDAVDQLRTGPLAFYTKDGSGAPYCEDEPGAMPHEFAVGAFRHGHSQVREGYLLNRSGGGVNAAGFGQLFGDRAILISNMVDFRAFFEGVSQFDPDAGAIGAPAPSMLIDTVLSPPLAELMVPSIPAADVGDPVRGALAPRNLLSDSVIGVVSGIQAATELEAAGLTVEPLTDTEITGLGFDDVAEVAAAYPDGLAAADLPLWVYVLAEAEIREGGTQLGTVGETIIGETIVGLLRCDPNGVFADGTNFVPTIEPAAGLQEPGHFRMADLINFALEQ